MNCFYKYIKRASMKIFNQNAQSKQYLSNKSNIRLANITSPYNNVALKKTNTDIVSFTSIQKQSITDKINSLKGDPFENANKIKEILLEDMGFPKNCIQVEVLNPPENEDGYCDYFNMSTGNILIHRNPRMTKQDIALRIRHELEHFKQSLAIIKNHGLDEYKNYIEGNKKEIENRIPGISTKFNTKLWNNKKLLDLVDCSKERSLRYLASFKERSELALEPDSEYKNLKDRYDFMCEQRLDLENTMAKLRKMIQFLKRG